MRIKEYDYKHYTGSVYIPEGETALRQIVSKKEAISKANPDKYYFIKINDDEVGVVDAHAFENGVVITVKNCESADGLNQYDSECTADMCILDSGEIYFIYDVGNEEERRKVQEMLGEDISEKKGQDKAGLKIYKKLEEVEKQIEKEDCERPGPGLEWCRKAKYDVQIELGCYEITDDTPLKDGFIEQEFEVDGEKKKFAVKTEENILEQNTWTTNPQRPYIITGTVGERWPVKPSNMSAYDCDVSKIGIKPIKVSTVDPKDQEFLVSARIPWFKEFKVIPSWAYREDGTIDESQISIANAEGSEISHGAGDYVVAKHVDGKPEYMELSEEERNTKEASKLYSPRVVNGSVMENTYDHAPTKEQIVEKYTGKDDKNIEEQAKKPIEEMSEEELKELETETDIQIENTENEINSLKSSNELRRQEIIKRVKLKIQVLKEKRKEKEALKTEAEEHKQEVETVKKKVQTLEGKRKQRNVLKTTGKIEESVKGKIDDIFK